MEFDINSLRSLATVVSFVMFVGILVWTFSGRKTADFEQAAKLPFEQD
jgi:cytochrome c oxidase cbb3-type subunit 4